jgi:hypothetical protein
MPCTDGGVPYESYRTPQPRYYNGLTAEQLEAVLCALLTNDATILGVVPAEIWEESGVTYKEAMRWWKSHKAADEARRALEDAERRQRIRLETLRESGLNKLTDAERLALGLK